MNEYFSRKIKLLSFFAIVGVVFCHAYNYYNRFLQSITILEEGTTPGAMLQFFISNGLVRFAVPLFFCFSGYLFFYNFQFSWKGYLQKVGKRVRTLVVPYLIWTALAGIVLYAVYKVVGLERYSIVAEKVGIFLEQGIGGWLVSSPAFQLWYIADLFKLAVFSPIIYWLVKKCKLFPVILFGILWFLEVSFIINYEALFFFTLGAYFAINKVTILGMSDLSETMNDKKKYKRGTALVIILWIVGCLTYTFLSATISDDFNKINLIRILALALLYKLNIFTGLVAVWRLYDLNAVKWQEKKWLKTAASCTVIIYMAHEPFQHLLTDMLLEKMTFNGAHTLIYFLLPVSTICGCILLGLGLKKVCPKVYSICIGGRG